MAARRLDHDHVGAEVAEHLPRARGVLARELDDAQSRRARPAVTSTHLRPRAASAISSSSRPSSSRQHVVVVLAEARARRARSTSRSPTGGPGCRRRGRRPSRGGARSARDPHSLVPGSWSMRSSGDATTAAGTPAARSCLRGRVTGRASRVHASMRASSASCVREPLGERRRTAASVAHGSSITRRERWPSRRRHGTRSRPTCRRPPPGRCRAAPSRGAWLRLESGWPVAPQRTAVHRVVEEVGTAQRGARLGARHVDPLTLTGAVAVDQPGEDRDRHEVGAHVVHVGEAPARGRQVGEPAAEREPADRLHDRAPRLERGVRAASRRSPQFDT